MKYAPDINFVKFNKIQLYAVNIWGIFHNLFYFKMLP